MDRSIQGRLEVGNELDLKMWVKDLIVERLERERLECRKPKIYSRNMWASTDRVGQSGACSEGVGGGVRAGGKYMSVSQPDASSPPQALGNVTYD